MNDNLWDNINSEQQADIYQSQEVSLYKYIVLVI